MRKKERRRKKKRKNKRKRKRFLRTRYVTKVSAVGGEGTHGMK